MDENVKRRFKARRIARDVWLDVHRGDWHSPSTQTCVTLDLVADAIVDMYEEAERASAG